MSYSLKHHFLIAMPTLIDSFFYHSVIYLCEHDEEGAMGLIINRPTRIMMQELLNHLQITNNSEWATKTAVLFGGPVQKDQGMVVHDGGEQWKNTLKITDETFLTTSSDILESLGTESGPPHSIVTLGYAAWEAGQLEQEIADNSWLTVQATPKLLYETPADERWQAAAKLLGIDINLMSNTTGHA
ncbi:MAG: YqgE/AlgH family protein [Methylophaga sp.]|jgi:putative transcriptional regulator|nr:YqgE/AlgH family protein [Methylophaga sp.]|tara:strand:- start:4562 stop:5119 length:558 start_codon:yes stop_codon:yes gene_type:complete